MIWLLRYFFFKQKTQTVRMLHNKKEIEFKLFLFYNSNNNKTLLESSHDDHTCRDICQQYKKWKTKLDFCRCCVYICEFKVILRKRNKSKGKRDKNERKVHEMIWALLKVVDCAVRFISMSNLLYFERGSSKYLQMKRCLYC